MRRIIFFLILLTVTNGLTAQIGRNLNRAKIKFEEYSYLIDSLYYYTWDNINENWQHINIWQNEYSLDKLNRLLFINADSREPLRAWDYYYDDYGNRNLEISTYWRNNTWKLTSKVESEYDLNNTQISRLISMWKNESWIPDSYYYSEYLDDKLINILFQKIDAEGNYHDQSYSEYIYENEKLLEVLRYNSADNKVSGLYQFIYDENHTLIEYIVSFPEINSSDNVYFVPSSRRLYYYDDYSLLKEVIFQVWNNVSWDTKAKYVYYHKLDYAQKVAVCHDEKTLWISKNSVLAHLNHGDYLGKCTDEQNRMKGHGACHCEDTQFESGHANNSEFNSGKSQPDYNKLSKSSSKNSFPRLSSDNNIKIFPNPVTDKNITISFENNEYYNRIDVLDITGRIQISYNVKHQYEFHLNLNGINEGTYFLRFIGEKFKTEKIIIE